MFSLCFAIVGAHAHRRGRIPRVDRVGRSRLLVSGPRHGHSSSRSLVVFPLPAGRAAVSAIVFYLQRLPFAMSNCCQRLPRVQRPATAARVVASLATFPLQSLLQSRSRRSSSGMEVCARCVADNEPGNHRSAVAQLLATMQWPGSTTDDSQRTR